MKEIKEIKRLITLNRKRLEKKFGKENTFFDIQVTLKDKKLLLEGVVISQKLKDFVLRIVKTRPLSYLVDDNLKVLSDYHQKLEIGWGQTDILLNIYPKPDKDLVERKAFATQILPGESFRVLKNDDDWFLVQTEDLALGWLPSDNSKSNTRIFLTEEPGKNGSAIAEKFYAVKRVFPGEMIDIPFSEKELERRIEEISASLIGLPYVFGGRSPETGFDCSGFTQKIVYAVSGYLLPKNSRDQARCGSVVTQKTLDDKKLRVGDLVFIRAKKKIPHIGIATSKGIFHSGGDKNKVTFDDFKKIRDKNNFAYQWIRDFSAVIRIFKFKKAS